MKSRYPMVIAAAAVAASAALSSARADDHVYKVRLTGLGFVERPILCQDLATVDLMYRWSVAHLQDGMANAMSRGAYGRVYGTSSEPPLRLYGCISVPNGTLAIVMSGYKPDDPTAWLTVSLPGNTVYTGVTMMREFHPTTAARPPNREPPADPTAPMGRPQGR